MQTKFTLLSALLGGVLFTLLFHNQYAGLNVLIFELVILAWLFYNKQLSFKNTNSRILIAIQMLTCLFTVITHSTFVYYVHFATSFVFTGVLIYPSAKSLLNSARLSLWNIVAAQIEFLRGISQSSIMNHQPGRMMKEARLFIIPMFIVSIFMLIYNKSNPKFNELTTNATAGIFDFINIIFTNYDLTILITFAIGILISNLVFFKKANPEIILQDLHSNDMLSMYRSKIISGIDKIKLKNEFKSAMFLLIVLNSILFVVNIIDINWVWFGFEWEGQYLKQFVHEGTYLLIFSILISIAIVLYFFRGGLNYVSNKYLKYLSYMWLAQNLILAVSVGIRNFYYIQHFNLAYKRIGVIIFLALTIYGLYSVMRKVKGRYSPFYLFRTNLMVLLIVLTFGSLINWDTVIAKYNFSRSNRAFIHYNFLAHLSDSALPILDKSEAELNIIDAQQSKKFKYEAYYLSSKEYQNLIQKRKNEFRRKWESKNFLSWNLAEQIAYNNLKRN